MNISELSIKRPSLVVVLFSLFTLLGIIGYRSLGYELLPDFNQPVIVIKTLYPGAEPEEVENSVSRKIEDALSNLEGIDYLETKSLPNASVIIANLKYGTNLDKSMQDAQRYVDNIRNELPVDIHNPVISKVSPNDLPIMSISATSSLPGTEFHKRLTDDFLPRIRQLRGVAELTILGGEEREIQVRVDQDKLRYYRISLLQVTEAVMRSGLDIPSGKVQSDVENNSVRLIGKFTTLEELRNVQISMPVPGSPVYLKDVAAITDGVKEMESVSRLNGVGGIGILLKKQGDANAVEVSADVRATLKQIEGQNTGDGIKFIIADDSTDNTIAAVDSVIDDLILAVILVSLVMLLFLKSYRNSLIVLISIPTSLVTSFAVMWLLGYTLNLMTLLAMSLIIGILVDDAIVVIENIQRHLDMGKDKTRAAIEGRMEIGFSAISITLVIVVVFLPILFLKVFVADMLKQFSIVVITSTLTSLLVCFTLTPWLASVMGKKENLQPVNFLNRFLLWFGRQTDRFIDGYGKALDWVLSHKLIFTAALLALAIITTGVMKLGIIGKEMMSTGDQGKFRLNIEFDRFTTVKQNNLVSIRIENYIMGYPEVATVFSNIAGPGTGIGSLGVGSAYKSEFTIQLKPAKERESGTESFMKRLKGDLETEFSGVSVSMAVLGLLPKTAPVKITLSGNDRSVLDSVAGSLRDRIKLIPGADNVQLSVEKGNPEFKVIPDKEKMQRLGLSTAYVGINLRQAFTGNDEATLTEDGTEYPVRIWFDEFSRTNYDDVSNLMIITPAGIPVNVGQFAAVSPDNSPSLLERLDRQTSITITAESFGRPSGSLADDVISWLDSEPLPDGVKLTWGSDIKTQNESFGAMGSVLLVSFILIYLIMVALYDSYIYPLVALFGIPVSGIGAILALNLSLNHITLFALLGLIMTMGLVTKNAILIVDFTNQIKTTGKHYRDALIIAGRERMRPILMTTLAMAVGMLPIALASGTASEWKNGLAWVIIGGLLSSLLLTVFLVPVAYYVVDSLKEKKH